MLSRNWTLRIFKGSKVVLFLIFFFLTTQHASLCAERVTVSFVWKLRLPLSAPWRREGE